MAKKRKGADVKIHEAGSLERFVMEKLHRSKLLNATYNPRVIRDDERARLRGVLEHLGMLTPIVWNRRTGNIVGGHQRVSIMDDLYATADYELTVAAVDLSDTEEREANIALNNPQAQGDWDLAKLEEMFKDTPTMKIEATGFDAAELFKAFGASPFEQRADDALSETAQKIREARERQATTKASVKEREAQHFYLVVVFKDDAERIAFTEAVGWEDNRYQDGRQLRIMCGPWIAARVSTSGASEPGDGETTPTT